MFSKYRFKYKFIGRSDKRLPECLPGNTYDLRVEKWADWYWIINEELGIRYPYSSKDEFLENWKLLGGQRYE